MSNVYATEPATAGRVILETTDGPLEIHLWCRECPQTTRMFLQFCQDGFYDNMVWHRIVNNFLIQTGALRHQQSSAAPMSSPEAAAYRQAVQAPQALERRSREVNSRIRFNHRGQVAMALGVDDKDDLEDLQPQFFITLEDAPYLDGKHVVFGTVSGPTIFNALRIGRTETDESTHQPVDMPNATRIQSVKIVENPLHQDISPHPNPPWRIKAAKDDNKPKKKKKKRKGKLDINVLSFGTELEEEDAVPTTKKGMQSSHDVVESKVLSKQVDEQVKGRVENEYDDNPLLKVEDKKASSKKCQRDSEDDNDSGPKDSNSNTKPAVEYSSRKNRKEEKKEEAELTKESRKRKDEEDEKKASEAAASKQKSLVESRRLKYTKGKKSKKEREEETLNKLFAFRSTVQQKVEERKSSKGGGGSSDQHDDSLASRMARRAEKEEGEDKEHPQVQAPTYHGQVLDSDGEEDKQKGEGKWLGTAFKCKRHVDYDSQNLGGDGRDALKDYEVIDSKRRGHKKRHHHKSSKRKHHQRD